MTRKQLYKEIEATLGLVPSFFERVPDSSLELEWELVKRVEFEEGEIPNKYRSLIGLGLAAGSRDVYGVIWHTEMSKLAGATDAEIEEAVHLAKNSAGWCTYVSGLQSDVEQFKEEVVQICEHIRSAPSVTR